MSTKLITQKKRVTVTKEIPVGINIDLSFEEAQLIMDMVSNFAGCPKSSTRKYAGSISDKLSAYLSYNSDLDSTQCWFTWAKQPNDLLGIPLTKAKINTHNKEIADAIQTTTE